MKRKYLQKEENLASSYQIQLELLRFGPKCEENFTFKLTFEDSDAEILIKRKNGDIC